MCYGDAETNDARGAIPMVDSQVQKELLMVGFEPAMFQQDIYGEDVNVEFVWGVGGDNKKTLPSWILQKWKEPKI